MDQVEPDSGWAYLMQISNLTPEEYRQVIQDFDDYVKFLNQFSQAWQKGPITFSEFAKEMGIGLGRGGVHIVEGMVEHPVVVGTTVGLILAAGRWIPHPYVKYVSWGLLAVGVGASSVQMGLGIYEGIQAYRYNSRDRLREASTHFGVGVLGLGLTYFGVKLGNHFAGAGSAANAGTRGGILASALHSPDEIVAALAIIQGARASAQPSEAKDSEKK